MKGSVRVVVSTKKLRYELNLRRNITILQGDSASGKTTLIQIISDYQSGRTGPGTEIVCDRKCIVLAGDAESAIMRLESLTEAVVFVDEQERFLYSKAFSEAVLASGCYFVFVTRDGLNMLPYSVNEIYYLKNSGYYQNTRQVYNSMYQVYPEAEMNKKIEPSLILAEDSNAGYEMYEAIGQDIKVSCDSAGGKSNIAKYILANKEEQILAIVDGAASGIVQAEGLGEIMENPGNFIESSEYSSWERFFTCLLDNLTRNTIYAYSKKKLNPNYLTRGNIDKMEKRMLVTGLFD